LPLKAIRESVRFRFADKTEPGPKKTLRLLIETLAYTVRRWELQFTSKDNRSLIPTKSLDLFAGIPVADYTAALKWYEQLLGCAPTFFPHDTEAVWELAEHRYVYIVQQSEHAGHAMHTLFVDGLDALVAQIADRGLSPAKRETYSNGVCKITYRDNDGNEIGFGGAPK
jgi:hypothetical protein